ncbi:MAG: Uncharacterised protein [Bacteroidia bacterium]|nr:MAG: Uncharacterised protein [Bacteroidia bacterium]
MIFVTLIFGDIPWVSTGPRTSSTFAPRSARVLAIAFPILPVLWFPINRTGSIFSCVGPAFTNIVFPVNAFETSKWFETNSKISSGSHILPIPTSPLANSPAEAGSSI